jgi:hypothetical protein
MPGQSNRVNHPCDFLDLLFGPCPPDLYLLIWQLEGKRSTWFRVAHLDAAAEFAGSRKDNIYFGAALSPADLGPWKRCEADRVACIVGLWADIDIKGEAHKKKNLPETMEQALALSDSLDINLTFRVDSGHGLQAYWLLNEPWIFANDAERQQARQLVERFQVALRRSAEERNWQLPPFGTLAPSPASTRQPTWTCPAAITPPSSRRCWLACMLRCHVHTLWEWVKLGWLPQPLRLGPGSAAARRMRWRRDVIEQFLREQEARGADAAS